MTLRTDGIHFKSFHKEGPQSLYAHGDKVAKKTRGNQIARSLNDLFNIRLKEGKSEDSRIVRISIVKVDRWKVLRKIFPFPLLQCSSIICIQNKKPRISIVKVDKWKVPRRMFPFPPITLYFIYVCSNSNSMNRFLHFLFPMKECISDSKHRYGICIQGQPLVSQSEPNTSYLAPPQKKARGIPKTYIA